MDNDVNILKSFNRIVGNVKLSICIMFICLIIGIIAYVFFMPNRYQTTIQVMINGQGENSVYNQQEVRNNITLTTTYSEIFKSNEILNKISKSINNKYSIKDLKNMIIVTKREESQIIDINIQGNNRKDVALISKNFKKFLTTEVANKMKTNDVTFLGNIGSHINKVLPNIYTVLLVSLLNGMFISFIVIIMKNSLYKDLLNKYEVEKELNIPILGLLPHMDK